MLRSPDRSTAPTAGLRNLASRPAVGGFGEADALDIGSRRELFVDRLLIDRLEGARLKLHEPRLAPPVSPPRPHGHYATVLFAGWITRPCGSPSK